MVTWSERVVERRQNVVNINTYLGGRSGKILSWLTQDGDWVEGKGWLPDFWEA